jgi:plastocyanin
MVIPHFTRFLRAAIAAVSAFVLLAGGALVAQAATPQPQTWTVRVGAQSANLMIQGMAYLPANVFIHPGDSIHWVANSAEPHTVTFPVAGDELAAFNPGDPAQLFKAGGDVYDPSSYFNSGILATVQDSLPTVTDYSLTFPDAGSFDYWCLVHGVMQHGVVHVISADQPLPFTQADYDRQAKQSTHDMLLDGNQLQRQARARADSHTVIMGADDGVAMVMRFLPETLVVHTGESVTFLNDGMGAPHTVTFGQEPANFAAPLGDPTNFVGGDLNSGIVPPFGGAYTVTFNQAGTFRYVCALHDYMGMVGTIIVQP